VRARGFAEQAPLVFIQQVARPFDRRSQRLLAQVGPASGLEQVEALREMLEQLLR
jgi:hypothetical protein